MLVLEKLEGVRCELVRLSLSAESASHSVVFFSSNKSANNTFIHDFLDK